MVRKLIGTSAVVVVCLTCGTCSDGGPPSAPATASAPRRQVATTPLEGVWSGSWGGGGSDGVVFLPVLAEMVVLGDHVELAGFPDANDGHGTIRIDADAGRIWITPMSDEGGAPAAPAEYAYELNDDELELTDSQQRPILLQRREAVKDPLANVPLEFVLAEHINEAGSLHVTQYTAMLAGRSGQALFEPRRQSLATRGATVLLVQADSVKTISLNEARRLLREPMPVAIAYRADDYIAPDRAGELWKEAGPPAPDGDAVGRTFARLLRPGTLVFVLSARENVPVP